jgi:hypothetical protein
MRQRREPVWISRRAELARQSAELRAVSDEILRRVRERRQKATKLLHEMREILRRDDREGKAGRLSSLLGRATDRDGRVRPALSSRPIAEGVVDVEALVMEMECHLVSQQDGERVPARLDAVAAAVAPPHVAAVGMHADPPRDRQSPRRDPLLGDRPALFGVHDFPFTTPLKSALLADASGLR